MLGILHLTDTEYLFGAFVCGGGLAQEVFLLGGGGGYVLLPSVSELAQLSPYRV